MTLPALLVACGQGAPPTDVSGDYTIAITNESDTCDTANFVEGDTSMNVPFVVTQEDENVTGAVGGAAGGYLDLLLGRHVFTGQVEHDAFELTLYGDRAASTGNCAYTVNATMEGGIDEDTISGDITYRPADNGNPDCGPVTDCSTVQHFEGTRAPGH